jgi:cytochrome c oxidase cbb3-type subunit III
VATICRLAGRALSLSAFLAMLGAGAPLRADDSPPPLGLPAEDALSGVPLGDLAGGAQSDLASTLHNPDAGDHAAVEAGHMMFVKLNCADCHGFTATGAMGPDLTDKYWRYGGSPAAIYKSISEGRPQGMPAWGKALPPKDIWQLVAYIESLGGSFPPNFYQRSLQGDRPNEQVAPELDFEQALDGSPSYETQATHAAASGTSVAPAPASGKR